MAGRMTFIAAFTTLATVAHADILIQSIWPPAGNASSAPTCTGKPSYRVVYDLNKCTTVLSNGVPVQQSLEPFNATVYSVNEYYAMSNCDHATSASVLEQMIPSGECLEQSFGMPDLSDGSDGENTTDVVEPTNTAETSATGTLPTPTMTSTSTVSNTTLIASPGYTAVITNTTLVPETNRSLLVSVYTPTAFLATKDWCGSSNSSSVTVKQYPVPIGRCFTIPSAMPLYATAYVANLASATSVLWRWYQEPTCETALSLYYDVIGMRECGPLPGNATFDITLKAGPVPVTTTTVRTSTSTVPSPTPSGLHSNSAPNQHAIATVWALVAGFGAAVLALL